MARITLLLSVLTALVALFGGFRYVVDTIRQSRWRKRTTGKWLTVLALCLCAAPDAQATVINAASCSKADVSTALSAAANGDTVNIPGGSCTWSTSGLTVTQGYLTIAGVGAGTSAQCAVGAQTTYTCITDGTDKVTNPEQVLKFNAVTSGGLLRLTGITFLGGSGTVGSHSIINVEVGSTASLRIDHLKVYTTRTSGIQVNGCMFGVLDHNDFVVTENFYAIYNFNGRTCSGGANYGDGSWTTAANFGSANFLFVEDNTFTTVTGTCTFNPAMDGWAGSRGVFRHNTVFCGYVTEHGTMQRDRGVRALEAYSNTFTSVSSVHDGQWTCPAGIGSGSALLYNNTCTGPAFIAAGATINRVGSAYTVWGRCDTGTNAWDGNLGTAGYSASYPCLDQPGYGAGDVISGDPGSAPNDYPDGDQTNDTRGTNSTSGTGLAWNRPSLEPIYCWNNTVNGVGTDCTTFNASFIKIGTEIINSGPPGGYTAYTYPHPLQGASAPNPPILFITWGLPLELFFALSMLWHARATLLKATVATMAVVSAVRTVMPTQVDRLRYAGRVVAAEAIMKLVQSVGKGVK